MRRDRLDGVIAAGVAAMVLCVAACGGSAGSAGPASEAVPVTLGGAGPGDAARYLPLDVGSRWVFASSSGGSAAYVHVVEVVGADGRRPQAVVVRDSAGGASIEETFAPDLNGVAYLGSTSTDPIVRQFGDYWDLRYPVVPGQFVQLDRTGITFEDLDGDGYGESGDVRSTVTVEGTEAVRVPAGAFDGCVRVKTELTLQIRSSRTHHVAQLVSTRTVWLAPGIGWVRRIQTDAVAGYANSQRIDELVAYAVGGRTGTVALRPVPETLQLWQGGSLGVARVVGVDRDGREWPLPAWWASTTPSIAGVELNSYGSAEVTPGAPGVADIAGTVDEVGTVHVTVTVTEQPRPGAVSRVEVTPAEPVVLAIGEEAQLTAQALDGSWTPKPVYDATITWKTSDPAAVTVSAAGRVAAVGPGTATVWAECGTVRSPSVEVTVLDAGVLVLPTVDLVPDPARVRLYASVPGSAGTHGDTVAVIDPIAETVLSYVSVGSEPGRLALSDDGRYLYVALGGAGAVARVDLEAPGGAARDLVIPLGSDASGQRHAWDLAVMPGAPRTIAVSRSYPAPQWLSHAGIAIYDDDVARPATTAVSGGTVQIEFSSDPSRLFAWSADYPAALRVVQVDSEGALVLTTDRDVLGGAQDFTFAGGKLYGTNGLVYDPLLRRVLGAFAFAGPVLMETRTPADRVLYGELGYRGQSLKLRAFDPRTFTCVAEETLQLALHTPRSFARFGARGVAIRVGVDPYGSASDRILLLRHTTAR